MFGEIRNAQGERLDYSCNGAVRSDAAGSGGQVVVIGHGVTGNKDRSWAVALAEALEDRGIAALRLSFSGNGDSEGDFRDSTISKQVRDLGAVLDTLEGEGRQALYAGHSMGGAVGVLRASQDPRIRRLISLAGMVHVAEFARRKFGHLVPGADCMWDKPECPLSAQFMADMAAIDTVVEQGGRVRVPWLLVHGDADDVVPLQDSLDILERAGDDATLVQLPGVDHVFSDAGTPAMTLAVTNWLS